MLSNGTLVVAKTIFTKAWRLIDHHHVTSPTYNRMKSHSLPRMGPPELLICQVTKVLTWLFEMTAPLTIAPRRRILDTKFPLTCGWDYRSYSMWPAKSILMR